MLEEISVIIRSKNAKKTIAKTLDLLIKQTVRPKQIILVDTNSKDKTKEIALKYGCEVINLTDQEFNHAYSLNQGIKQAKSNLVILTNAHAFPISSHWVEDGIKHFQDKKVAGVFEVPLNDERASIWEKLEWLGNFYFGKKKRPKTFTKIGLDCFGINGSTNSIIRRGLWQMHYFDEQNFAWGGEDIEWAFYFLNKGYKFVAEPGFAVYHCHGENFYRTMNRYLTWFKSFLRAYLKYKFLLLNYFLH